MSFTFFGTKKHNWTRPEAERLKKFVDGKRCFIVLLGGEQIGFIDVPSEKDGYGANPVHVHYGSESDQDAYDLGNGVDIDYYAPSDFVVKKLIQIDWLTCDFDAEAQSSLQELGCSQKDNG